MSDYFLVRATHPKYGQQLFITVVSSGVINDEDDGNITDLIERAFKEHQVEWISDTRRVQSAVHPNIKLFVVDEDDDE